MAIKNRLELNWIGKDRRPRLEPRILLEDEAFSYHAPARKEGDIFDNVLIKGDNLLALKALEQKYAGQVKCVFIDPPYNTGSAFTHYDDGVEHSIWLGMMRDRLAAIYTLLSDDGSLWVTLDDNEAHYFKVMCDEIFGRSNFVRHITWQKKYSVSNNYKGIASLTDHVLVYRKTEKFQNGLLPRSTESSARYTNPDNDPRGPWKAVDYLNQATVSQRPNLVYDIVNPFTGEIVKNRIKAWKFEPEAHKIQVLEKRLWWGLKGENSVPALKLFLTDVRDGMTSHSWWPHSEVGHTDEAKKEMIALFGPENVFDTPKPERLLERILTLSTVHGDIVLDLFAGSGTTGAVAQKMGRRWIMVELGDHCESHVLPRLKKVIDGEQGGISQSVEWKGGGGFRYFKLAPSLLEKDAFDQWVISKSYNAEMLAEAMCKHFGFVYAPKEEAYWQHGSSSETDFIYITTAAMSFEQLKALSDEVGPDRSLVVCCKAFEGSHADAFANLTLRKIPNAILDQCEWGHDDYSLKIANLPIAEDEDLGLDDEPEPEEPKAKRKAKSADNSSADLFADESEG